MNDMSYYIYINLVNWKIAYYSLREYDIH